MARRFRKKKANESCFEARLKNAVQLPHASKGDLNWRKQVKKRKTRESIQDIG